MTPEDLQEAETEAAADLENLEGVDPDEFVGLLHAESDEYSDLDCDHGEALADELKELTDG